MSGTTIGGVDASIPLQAGKIGQNSGNPFAASPQNFLSTLNTMNQLRMFPGQLQLQQQQIQGNAQNLQNLQAASASTWLMPLLGQKVVSQQDLLRAIGNAQAHNAVVDPMLSRLRDYQAPVDPDTGQPNYRTFVAEHTIPTLPPEAQLQAVTPKGEQISQGGMISIGTRAPLVAPSPGTYTQQGGLPVVPSQNDLGQIKDVTVTADNQRLFPGSKIGEVKQMTQADYLRLLGPRSAMLGGPNMPPDNSGLPPTLRNPANSPPPASTSAPASTSSPAAPIAPPQAASPAPSFKPEYTGGALSPAAKQQQEQQGAKSADAYQNIIDAGTKAVEQDALLSNMQVAAQGFRPGPGADKVAEIKRFFLGLGAQFNTTFGIDPNKISSYEDLVKISNQIADAGGAGSDARLRVNMGANPSQHNIPEALDLITRQLRGNTDYARVKRQLASVWPNKEDMGGFETNVGDHLDPRTFQYARLTPEQRRDWFSGLTDKDAFKANYMWARDHGLISDAAQ